MYIKICMVSQSIFQDQIISSPSTYHSVCLFCICHLFRFPLGSALSNVPFASQVEHSRAAAAVAPHSLAVGPRAVRRAGASLLEEWHCLMYFESFNLAFGWNSSGRAAGGWFVGGQCVMFVLHLPFWPLVLNCVLHTYLMNMDPFICFCGLQIFKFWEMPQSGLPWLSVKDGT